METTDYEQNIMRRAGERINYVMASRLWFTDRDNIIRETAQA
jgi:hypothetical protein